MTDIMHFSKYDATGNDFVIAHDPDRKMIEKVRRKARELCQRHHGIGADGILLIHDSETKDFELSIFNSDGTEAEMCANGARASLHFLSKKLEKNTLSFKARGGEFQGKVLEDHVTLTLESSVEEPKIDLGEVTGFHDPAFFILGVPHLILPVSEVEKFDVVKNGRTLRNLKIFEKGTNVNFYQEDKGIIRIRTYERGVEGETLSCGTGIMSTAYLLARKTGKKNFQFETQGGNVEVELKDNKVLYKGKVKCIYQGAVNF